ncbi:MAG: 30S ribosome-binding factor RbfA [Oscillospiraceae bacterium]|jgi:ribosome-binding factor A|nr:30S ribosome-binding factor RbfA [Oscillospiraceae bacterium]MBQ5339075.1 30S ribosome-binding factor RbfA [Oscillospiraceae bacterium]MBR5364133.1 30S ribosome-binding factor RbfA [Oscillospiraceae bacterium]
MASFKIGRLQEDILRELTAIMREEIKDPRITPDLTIVRAELSGDMGHCKAYISSLTDLSQAEEACRVLTKASGFIRKELFHRLKLRKSPELHFIADDSIAYAADISEKLNGLGLTEGNAPAEEPDETEF